jgi:hypothetical protein
VPLPPRPGRGEPTIVSMDRILDVARAAGDTEPSAASPAAIAEAVKLPANPTLAEIYRLIDERIPPEISVRLSTVPPPESRPSKAAAAAKATGRWTKWAMAAIGLLAVVGQLFAGLDKYRGPISQAVVILARVLDSQEAAPRIEREPRPLLPPPPEPPLPEPEPGP